MEKDKITIFLDFDGVLYDTLKEAYILCRRVCRGIDFFEPIEDDIYAKFYKFKYLVYNSWQFYYLMEVILGNETLTDNQFVVEYNKKLVNRDFDREKIFEDEFLKNRKILIEKYFDYVDKLETKFKFFDDIMKLKDNKKYDILIVSRKNKFAIKRKFFKNNIDDIKIIGKEDLDLVVNKSEFIEQYMKTNNIQKAFFVDDNSHNLKPCKNIPNLTCLLAGWGNIGINEQGYTQEEVIEKILLA